MKKASVLCCVILMVLGVFVLGCGNKERQKEEKLIVNTEDKIQVMATIFAPYDFARQVLGEYGQVNMLLPPAVESHSYEPTPQDIINIQNCDVFVYVGGESDTWVKGILEEIDTTNIKIISLMDCISGLEGEAKEHVEHQEDGHSHEHEHGAYDEHVWTYPKNAIAIVEAMTAVFEQLDQQNAAAIKEQSNAYVGALQALDASFQQVVEQGQRNTLIFGDRFPLLHFVEAYELDYFAAFPGCAEDTEPSAATLTFLIDKVKEENIPVVFHIELSNQGITDTICNSTGAKKQMFHTCHNISKEDLEQGETYLSLMEKNVVVLKEALGEK